MSLTPSVEEARQALPNRVKPKSAKTSREVQNQLPPETISGSSRRPNTSEGLHRSSPTELSLWRDSQAVQAYLGSSGNSRPGPPPIIAKLPSPNSWASRTAASCALTGHNQSEPQQDSNSEHHHYEEIMELKRQLVHMNQDLHLTKISRSLSTGNGSAAVMAMISPTSGEVVGAPGSPYRASSGTALNSAPKPSLSKELMQKLRSMTETIKMLSDENAQLRTQNEEILRAKKEEMARNNRKPNGLYDDLDKQQLVDLVLSYDEKLKALSSEVSELQKKLKAADEASREIEAASAASKSTAEKDKYKQLARRLKEERNNYRDSLDAKQKEQADLKVEMEKMSDLISELRVNCQTLQTELSEVRAVSKDRSDAAVQASLLGENSRPSTRKLSTSSISQESIRKARSVYGAKQPKPRYTANNNNTVSLSSLNNREAECNKINKKITDHRASSMSPAKQANVNGGPRIAKPVSRINHVSRAKANNNSNGGTSSPTQSSSSKLPISPGSNVSSTLSTSVRTTPSKIPQPETPSPRKSRIPSAPRYITPNRYTTKSPSTASVHSVISNTLPNTVPGTPPPSVRTNSPLKSPASVVQKRRPSPAKVEVTRTVSSNSSVNMSSPPPPPPPTQMEDEDEIAVTIDVQNEVIAILNEEQMPKPILEVSPQPPPPGPPVSRISHQPCVTVDNENDQKFYKSTTNQSEDTEPEEEEDDEEILRVTSGQDGNVMEIAISSKTSSQVESPIVPSVSGCKSNYSQNSSGSEENPSADDEGSRDGDDSGKTGNAVPEVDCTPRTKKKVEHFRQGLAARRIQRTWKHFYEELEERKDVRSELPAPLVQVIEDKAKLESQSTPSPSPTKVSPDKIVVIDQEKVVTTIEDAFVDHQRRERALAGMKAKIHTARPWQKKKTNNESANNHEESSEEELERAYRALHLRGNDIRAKVSIIKADQELFTSGKVSEMKARLNERRSQTNKKISERSDGITEEDEEEDYIDDDDDVVIY